MPRYLTKSRFKLAIECETKLFYTNKKQIYADQSLDDPFLKNLAQGGFQVGELAKYYFIDGNINSEITIERLDYNGSLLETQKRIDEGVNIIAEAAFRFENLFIRTDIFQISKENKTINLYEVKAKSYDSKVRFFTCHKPTGEITGINSEWRPYLFDVAFQKYVLSKCYPDYLISSFLVMADKESIATVDGLNQLFKINNSGDRIKVEVKEGLRRDQLGKEILIRVKVDEEVQWIWDNPVNTKIGDDLNFKDYIDLLSNNYIEDSKIKTPIGSKCKKCDFKTTKEQVGNGLKSGFKECWAENTNLNVGELEKPLVTDLWCGGCSKMGAIIQSGIFLLKDIQEEMLVPKKESKKEYTGMTPTERRMLQINKVKNGDYSVYIDREGLKKEMDSWTFPLHFIDFETSRVAIPFNSGRRPYEEIAFQFSHHVINQDYSIEHAGEYISFEPGIFPNYDFLRALKKELENDKGSVFRYHNHENTVLNEIYEQLSLDDSLIEDKVELMDFIKSITHKKDDWVGERDMIDLFKLVTSYYYPPGAGGSNSLKYILPATIKASDFLKDKYSKPVYGSNIMPSKNFSNKIWLETIDSFNPYKSLPPVFENYDQEQLDSLIEGFEEIAEGGAAMTAYAKLQFTNVPKEQRIMLRNALLKYCELDTLAMVMIWEFWVDEVYKLK